MLGSTIKVNRTLTGIPSIVRNTFVTIEQIGNAADREAALRTYRKALEQMEEAYARDSLISSKIIDNPYVEDYTYGHFLQVLSVRSQQCVSDTERENLRLKYYPLATIDPGYTGTEWREVIETLQVDIDVVSPWLSTVLRILSFGLYNAVTKSSIVKVQPKQSMNKPSEVTDTGLVGNH